MKNSKKTIMKTISILGISISIFFVGMEYITENFCPVVFRVPACYLILISFVLLLISQFDWENRTMKIASFYLGAFLGLILSIWFSYNHFLKLSKCPLIVNKIPACYVFLIVFLVVFSSGREI